MTNQGDQSQWYTPFWKNFVTVSMGVGILAIGAIPLGLYFIHKIGKQQTRQMKWAVVMELYRLYADAEMARAVQTVWTTPPEKLVEDVERDQLRRRVSDFWNMVGVLVKEELVEASTIRLRFQDAPAIWEKLEPVEMMIRRKIEKRQAPELGESDIELRARRHVDNLPAAWLYHHWRQRYLSSNR